ncbi:hypothetical protein [Streptomyces huasconensis]|uniref:hypothetical protein n=1 Tax=Streptomyces TaxID=1883 RepID=UPI0038B4E826
MADIARHDTTRPDTARPDTTGSGTARPDTARHDTTGSDTTRSGTALFPPGERDKLSLRLQNAVSGFVDGPRGAVEEVDHVLEEAIARLSETLAERRRTLRSSWQTTPAQPAAGGGTPAAGVAPGGALATEGAPAPEASATDTEQLRLALRDYRETAERLLRL